MTTEANNVTPEPAPAHRETEQLLAALARRDKIPSAELLAAFPEDPGLALALRAWVRRRAVDNPKCELAALNLTGVSWRILAKRWRADNATKLETKIETT
jgi:hypothetical protein